MLTRSPTPAAVMSAASTRTNCFADAVSDGASAEIFVSMLNRTESAERDLARAKTSDSSGIRAPGEALCRGNDGSVRLPQSRVLTWARRRVFTCFPTYGYAGSPGVAGAVSRHLRPSTAGSCVTTARPSRVIWVSSSSVVTPRSSAWPNAARVDSTVRPAPPRWASRSKVRGASAAGAAGREVAVPPPHAAMPRTRPQAPSSAGKRRRGRGLWERDTGRSVASRRRSGGSGCGGAVQTTRSAGWRRAQPPGLRVGLSGSRGRDALGWTAWRTSTSRSSGPAPATPSSRRTSRTSRSRSSRAAPSAAPA